MDDALPCAHMLRSCAAHCGGLGACQLFHSCHDQPPAAMTASNTALIVASKAWTMAVVSACERGGGSSRQQQV